MFSKSLIGAFSAFVIFGISNTAFAADKFKIGLVLDKGGKDDKSFNSAAFAGATKARKDLSVEVKTVEATDDSAIESLVKGLAKNGFNLVIGVGFVQQPIIEKIAKQFPKVSFALVDAKVDLPNVRSLLFQEHEGSFVVGYLAGLKTKTNKVGFIGGMDIPLIRRFQMGYEAGVKYANPKINVVSNYVGVTSDAWRDPGKGKELGLSQYSSGADIIFTAAGASGLGVFDAAEEKKHLVIGVDSNQNWLKPGFVLTSMMKRVDVAVYQCIADLKANKFSGGVQSFGLSNQGVDYALDEHNRKLLTPDLVKKAEALKKEIISGKITVPDFYKNGK